MTHAVATVSTLLDLAVGRRIEHDGPARRDHLLVGALLSALACAGLWGAAAGSADVPTALGNLYKVPMVVALSSLAAVPAGLVVHRLFAIPGRTRDVLHAFALAVFSGTLVLAVASPLVALYYHSSTWAGPYLAMGSAALALVTALVMFTRGVWRHAATPADKAPMLAPVIVMTAMQLAAMLQLVALASPILPEQTVFDGGVDRLAETL